MLPIRLLSFSSLQRMQAKSSWCNFKEELSSLSFEGFAQETDFTESEGARVDGVQKGGGRNGGSGCSNNRHAFACVGFPWRGNSIVFIMPSFSWLQSFFQFVLENSSSKVQGLSCQPKKPYVISLDCQNLWETFSKFVNCSVPKSKQIFNLCSSRNQHKLFQNMIVTPVLSKKRIVRLSINTC